MYKQILFKERETVKSYSAILLEFDSKRVGIPFYIHWMKYQQVFNVLGLVLSIRLNNRK